MIEEQNKDMKIDQNEFACSRVLSVYFDHEGAVKEMFWHVNLFRVAHARIFLARIKEANWQIIYKDPGLVFFNEEIKVWWI